MPYPASLTPLLKMPLQQVTSVRTPDAAPASREPDLRYRLIALCLQTRNDLGRPKLFCINATVLLRKGAFFICRSKPTRIKTSTKHKVCNVQTVHLIPDRMVNVGIRLDNPASAYTHTYLPGGCIFQKQGHLQCAAEYQSSQHRIPSRASR